MLLMAWIAHDIRLCVINLMAHLPWQLPELAPHRGRALGIPAGAGISNSSRGLGCCWAGACSSCYRARCTQGLLRAGACVCPRPFPSPGGPCQPALCACAPPCPSTYILYIQLRAEGGHVPVLWPVLGVCACQGAACALPMRPLCNPDITMTHAHAKATADLIPLKWPIEVISQG